MSRSTPSLPASSLPTVLRWGAVLGIVSLVVAVSVLDRGTSADAARAPDGPRSLVPTTLVPSRDAARDAAQAAGDRIDRERLLRDLSILAHDSMEGRESGADGNRRARAFLEAAFEERGLAPVAGARTHTFPFTDGGTGDPLEGVNVMGLVRGTEEPGRYLVVTAHYDHLGVRDGEVYNGADDNGSGTAALLAIAEHLVAHPLGHSVLFVAFDAEEKGLQGARAWVADPPVPLDSIVLNVNLDMVSRSEAGELYAVGTWHRPFLLPLVREAARTDRLALRTGHDRPDLPPGDDWTSASDHAPFHAAGVPFIYFGVEDHPGYHRPSDTFENITPDFYVAAVETVLDFLRIADREAATILRERTP